MARATRYGGPSYTEDELADPKLPAVIIKRAEIGYVDRQPAEQAEDEEVESSPGNSSNQSSENEGKSAGKSDPSPRQPARTTGNRSSQQDKETHGTARSTGTAGQRTKRGPARARTTDDEFDDFD